MSYATNQNGWGLLLRWLVDGLQKGSRVWLQQAERRGYSQLRTHRADGAARRGRLDPPGAQIRDEQPGRVFLTRTQPNPSRDTCSKPGPFSSDCEKGGKAPNSDEGTGQGRP